MIENKSIPTQFQKDLAIIRRMKAVKWARMDARYLYVCTRAKMLRHRNPGKKKYLPQIVIRFNLNYISEKPTFKYLHVLAELYNMHPSIDTGIGNWMDGWKTPICWGENLHDYRKIRIEGGFPAGVEFIIRMLQFI